MSFFVYTFVIKASCSFLVNKLYTVNGTGQYNGKKILKGFKGDANCIITATGRSNDFEISVKIIGKKFSNGNEKVTWKSWTGQKFNGTRTQFYDYMDSLLKISDDEEYLNALSRAYGKLYKEYVILQLPSSA